MEEELYERMRLEVDKGQSPLRIDKYVSEHMSGTSRNRIQLAAEAGLLWVNGKSVCSSYKVKPLDTIQILLDHEPHDCTITPEDMPLDIVYEDEDLLVVNKPAGLVVHPGHGNWEHTLLHGLAGHFCRGGSAGRLCSGESKVESRRKRGVQSTEYRVQSTEYRVQSTEYRVQSTEGAVQRGEREIDMNDPSIGLCHRIDKDTSGLLVVAKTAEAKSALGQQFFEHTTERSYQALVWGSFKEDEGTIEGALARDDRDRTSYRIYDLSENPNAKEAITHYKVLERFLYVTLVECRLETGRTHQIRVHMKSIGHPLFGDEKYGGMEILKGVKTQKYQQFIHNCFEVCPRQALHARSLGFVHPRTGERMYFEAEMPEDMSNLLSRWRAYGGPA